jgi:hypothetical protein
MPAYLYFVLLALCLLAAPARGEPICVTIDVRGTIERTQCVDYFDETACEHVEREAMTVVICAPEV